MTRPDPRRACAALAFSACLLAAAVTASADSGGDPRIPFERYQLDNGLEVILHQDQSVPIVAVDVWYHVGAGDEVPGKSGFAHIFEHMLFQGSKHVGEDKHFDTLKSIGSSFVNGTTNTDRTNYFEVVPSHQLETALWLESDRMGYFLPLLTQKSLDNQLSVVLKERQQRIESRPYGESLMGMYATLYPADHPYHGAVIGTQRDIASAQLAEVRAFYRKWYVPANATLVLAGDFETEQAKALVQKWFGAFPKTTKPQHNPRTVPVVKRARKEFTDKLAKLRRISYAWHTPAYFAPGDAEFSILGNALASSTGRLYRILVHEKQLAQGVRAYQDSMQGSSIFAITVTLKSDADLAVVEKILDEEIETIRANPVSPREMQRAVTAQEAAFIWGLEHVIARAELLQRYAHYVGNPDNITSDLDRYRKTSPEKIREFAAEYLVRDRRVEVLTVPADAPETKGGK